MRTIHDAWSSSDLPTGVVATIGNFDGVHRGQQVVISRVVERAREIGAPSAVVTFEPHPLQVLRPKEAPPRLTGPAAKERLLEATGVDHVLVVPFDAEVAGTTAEAFVRQFLVGGLQVREVHVGVDFLFGRKREGDVALLEQLGAKLGFRAVALDEVRDRGERISSSRIRRALAEGNVELAANWLGRPHAIEGRVVRGDRMGKRLGWPTINIDSPGALVPLDGVYASQVRFASFPSVFDAATNVGTRPTVYQNYQRVVESHVLEFSSDVYNEPVELTFHKRLRDERIFPTIMDLSAQIRHDVDATREHFAGLRRALLEAVETS